MTSNTLILTHDRIVKTKTPEKSKTKKIKNDNSPISFFNPFGAK